ncbi:MAG TPA: NUDIX hydrolase [Kineosporiaceae bacterium]
MPKRDRAIPHAPPCQAGPAGVEHVVPTVPASAGALIRDRRGRLLLLKPTYKSGWTLPGGEMEDTGESPWQACRREVREECGLQVPGGRLVCVDFRPGRPGRPGRRGRRGGVRFLFDCGALDDAALAGIRVQPGEISEHRFAELPAALELLRKPVRRRVAETLAAPGFVYLEDGRRVDGVG